MTPCYYCGLPATCTDHVVPLVVVAQLQAIGALDDVARRRKLTVPACTECNTVAGAKYFDTLEERADYVKQRLRKRLAPQLAYKRWDARELEDMQPEFRNMLVMAELQRELAEKRLAWRPGTDKEPHALAMVVNAARDRRKRRRAA